MTSLAANLLLAALRLVSPDDGAEVSVIRENQQAYLSLDRASRHAAMRNAEMRSELNQAVGTPEPVVLKWEDAEGPMRLEVLCVETDEKQEFLLPLGTTEAPIVNLGLGRTYRWAVRSGDEQASAHFKVADAAPRLLYAEGLRNFRDLGGWKTSDGRRVRQDRLLRSAGLRGSAKNRGGDVLNAKYEAGDTRITPRGLATLKNEFHIKTDIELRTRQEAAMMTSSALGADVKWVHIPFAAYDFIGNPVRGREPFYDIFRVLAEERNYPVLFHCSGGRDRTGTLAFLLGAILGVSDEDLCRDWEATVFSEESASFTPARLERLLKYLKSLGGKTFAESAVRYAHGCGITDDEIARFRAIMLERAGGSQ